MTKRSDHTNTFVGSHERKESIVAVDQSIFQTQGKVGGGNAAAKFYVKTKTGQLEEIEIPYDQFSAPIDGWYVLKIKGFSAPTDDTGGQYGPSRKIRVLVIVKAPGTGYDKQMFSFKVSIAKQDKNGHWYPNVSNKSAAGQMIVSARGREIGQDEPINFADYIGMEIGAYVEQQVVTNDFGVTAYGNIRKDSWCAADDIAAKLAATQAIRASVPTPQANPFLDDDD